MKLTVKQFLKAEHWSLQLLYLIGIVCILFQLYFIFGNEPSKHTIVPVIGYSIVAILVYRHNLIKKKLNN